MGLGKTLLKWGVEKLKTFGCTTVAIWVLRENPNAILFLKSNALFVMG
ncbi:GNAT family N-acetyltransferase [Paenibacillus swuensis]